MLKKIFKSLLWWSFVLLIAILGLLSLADFWDYHRNLDIETSSNGVTSQEVFVDKENITQKKEVVVKENFSESLCSSKLWLWLMNYFDYLFLGGLLLILIFATCTPSGTDTPENVSICTNYIPNVPEHVCVNCLTQWLHNVLISDAIDNLVYLLHGENSTAWKNLIEQDATCLEFINTWATTTLRSFTLLTAEKFKVLKHICK